MPITFPWSRTRGTAAIVFLQPVQDVRQRRCCRHGRYVVQGGHAVANGTTVPLGRGELPYRSQRQQADRPAIVGHWKGAVVVAQEEVFNGLADRQVGGNGDERLSHRVATVTSCPG